MGQSPGKSSVWSFLCPVIRDGVTFSGSSQALSAGGAPALASEGLVEVRPVRVAELPRGPSQAPSVLGGRLACVTQSPAAPQCYHLAGPKPPGKSYLYQA